MKTSRIRVDSSTARNSVGSGLSQDHAHLRSSRLGQEIRERRHGHTPSSIFRDLFYLLHNFKETNVFVVFDEYLPWLESLKQCHGDI